MANTSPNTDPSQLISLREFAESINAAPDTVSRWGKRGVLGPDGVRRVMLKLTRIPNGWGTTIVDYNDFIAALNRKL